MYRVKSILIDNDLLLYLPVMLGHNDDEKKKAHHIAYAFNRKIVISAELVDEVFVVHYFEFK